MLRCNFYSRVAQGPSWCWNSPEVTAISAPPTIPAMSTSRLPCDFPREHCLPIMYAQTSSQALLPGARLRQWVCEVLLTSLGRVGLDRTFGVKESLKEDGEISEGRTGTWDIIHLPQDCLLYTMTSELAVGLSLRDGTLASALRISTSQTWVGLESLGTEGRLRWLPKDR